MTRGFDHQRTAERRAGRIAAAAFLAAMTLLAATPPAPEARPGALSARDRQYLERALGQLREFERKVPAMGQQLWAAGALTVAALADGRSAEAARWAVSAVDSCAGSWHKVRCERAQMSLQRLLLQYPRALPKEVAERVRREVRAAAPPPGQPAVRAPWDFKETENQRIVQTARSLVAEVVAGTPGSPAARAWGDYAKAFLLAHDRDGWYEAESPGYLAISIEALLHLADHAPQAEVRELAARQLNLLFAEWAQEQVAGFPAGAKSRTYSHWAVSTRSTPWRAWAWLAGALPESADVYLMEWPELATSAYEIPAPVVRLLAERRQQPSYEIRTRRKIDLPHRQDVDAALYSFATPDYILSASQSVGDLRFSVSGGQEIVATLFAEGPDFAPLYLWSRTDSRLRGRWGSAVGSDFAVADENVAMARLGADGRGQGHAWLARPWSRPEVVGDAVVSRYGDTYVALVTVGGWEVAPAPQRFPAFYPNKRDDRGSWVAVPKRQPADIALEVGRRAEDGDFAAWTAKIAKAELAVAEDGSLRFRASDGTMLTFQPGQRAAVAGKALEPAAYPLLDSPYLASGRSGGWQFSFKEARIELERLQP